MHAEIALSKIITILFQDHTTKVDMEDSTQEEIKDIVRYANERHITIVPEIEMPGHSERL